MIYHVTIEAAKTSRFHLVIKLAGKCHYCRLFICSTRANPWAGQEIFKFHHLRSLSMIGHKVDRGAAIPAHHQCYERNTGHSSGHKTETIRRL
jgi:hypothetical protein